VTLLAAVFTWLYRNTSAFHVSLSTTPFILIGVPLGIFLGFRNSAAYDRFWEGRKLWGQLMNTSRTFTRQVLTLICADSEDERPLVLQFQKMLAYRLAGYVHSLRLALRADSYGELERFLPANEVEGLNREPSAPNAILHQTGALIVEAWRRGWIHTFHVPLLDQTLAALADVQGGCERIKTTPLPFSYRVLIHRSVAIYCFLLPFGLAETLGWVTPFVVMVISNAFFGLDSIGDEIENPFGHDINDLPLTQLSTAIEANIFARTDDPLPATIRPTKHELS
jgi:putative membrane protein